MPSDERHKFENVHGLRKSMKVISRESFVSDGGYKWTGYGLPLWCTYDARTTALVFCAETFECHYHK